MEIAHELLMFFDVINKNDPVVGYRVHYYLFSFRQV